MTNYQVKKATEVQQILGIDLSEVFHLDLKEDTVLFFDSSTTIECLESMPVQMKILPLK
jgi:hypothetical protein